MDNSCWRTSKKYVQCEGCISKQHHHFDRYLFYTYCLIKYNFRMIVFNLYSVLGGFDHSNNAYDEVYKFDADSFSWSLVSTPLQEARGYHAMSVVKLADIVDQCV